MFSWGLNSKKRIGNTGLNLTELEEHISRREKIAFNKGRKVN